MHRDWLLPICAMQKNYNHRKKQSKHRAVAVAILEEGKLLEACLAGASDMEVAHQVEACQSMVTNTQFR